MFRFIVGGIVGLVVWLGIEGVNWLASDYEHLGNATVLQTVYTPSSTSTGVGPNTSGDGGVVVISSTTPEKFVVLVNPSGFTQGHITAPLLKESIEPYDPPEICDVARHPELYHWLYSFTVPVKDGLILDPCCGSGNSLIAAREMGIRSVGIECQEHRAQYIQGRLNASTA